MYDMFIVIVTTPETSYLAIYVSYLFCDVSGIMKINDKIFEYYEDEQQMSGLVSSLVIEDRLLVLIISYHSFISKIIMKKISQ